MRRMNLVLAGMSGLAAVASSAFAADHTVTAGGTGLVFTPSTLTINVGDTVTFVNGGGFHNVKSDTNSVTAFRCANGCDGDGMGGNGDPSGVLWSSTVTFPTAGSAPFHCEVHGFDGGSGMSGTITIVAGGAPSISVDPTSISGSADAGSSTTSGFSIANSGTADLTWNATTTIASTCTPPGAVSWIALDPLSGTVASGAPPADVGVTLDATSLAVGVYTANICVHSNDAANDPLALPVQFTVNTPDLIFVDGFDG